jgi:hypothetical protein
VTVDAEGVITAKKTISIIFGASAERYAIWLILIRISDINGTRSILRKVTNMEKPAHSRNDKQQN